MNLTITFNHPEHSNEVIVKSIFGILEQNKLLSMATVSADKESVNPWINTAYFAYNELLEFFILTYPTSEHSLKVKTNPSVAINIFDSQQWGGYKKGLQISGVCELVKEDELAKATEYYKKRYDWLKTYIINADDWKNTSLKSRPYKITPQRIKIFDEETFGEETWVDVTL